MTTLSVSVSQLSDDCLRWDASGFATTSAIYMDAPLSVSGSSGMRFQNITVPQASVVNSGTFLTIAGYITATPSTSATVLKGQDSDTTTTFTNASDFDARPRTVESVSWTLADPWTAGVAYDSPSIAAIVQAIVDRAGWVSGNSLVIFAIIPRVTDVYGISYEIAGVEPMLTIDYGGAPPPPTAVPQLQLQKAGP